MKQRRYLPVAVLAVLALALVLYWSGYELRLVPNKPELRPKPALPSPTEITGDVELADGSERDNRGYPQREIIDLVSLFPGVFYREGKGTERKIALTFDDGPDSLYTPQILDILKDHNVKATFFLIGKRAEIFPDVVKRIMDEGHIIGNHSMNHANIAKLSNEETRREIMQAEESLFKLTGYRPYLFRSPYGSLTPEKVEFIKKLNFKVIAWNVDSLDWKSLSAEQVKTNILENVRAGSIILQHSSGSKEENLSGSVSALQDVITILKSEGYSFVTVPELLNIPYKK